jgi:Cu/Zn superoxide dismutase
MKHSTMISILLLAACGGSKKPAPAPAPEPEPTPAPVAAAPEPAPAPAPAPPPAPEPKVTKAKADLTPSKSSKFKAATITFAQPEGGSVTVASTGWFDGLKPGTYHLVVHDGADCKKPGAAFKAAATADMTFKADKDSSNVDVGGVAISLLGDTGVTGHVLVLTADKKGKPGATLACGVIAALDQTE